VNCQEARELFSARVDDALSSDERARLEGHLAGCPECRRELARFEGTVALLRGVVPARAPVGFVDRVLAEARPVGWQERLRRRLFQPLAWGQPIAATVGILVAVSAVYLYQKSPELQQAARPTITYPARVQADKADAPAQPAKTPAPPSPSGRPATPVTELESRLDASRDAPGAAGGKGKEATRSAPAPIKKESGLTDRTLQEERYATVTDETKRVESSETGAPSSGRVVASPRAAEPPASSTPPEPPAAAARPAEGPAAPQPAVPPGARERQLGARSDTDTRAYGRSGAANLASKTVALDVAGRLAVTDRPAAERALAALLARLGAVEVGRYAETDSLVVDVIVPGSAYGQLAEGLAAIGRWQPDRVPGELPPQVRVSVRLVN
jgi:anti-sigma factor RsiW